MTAAAQSQSLSPTFCDPPILAMRSVLQSALAVLILNGSQASSQQSDARELGKDARAVREVWKSYLDSKEGQYAANAGTPSSLWLISEQLRWPIYDLASFYLADGAVPEVLSVEAAADSDAPAYRIRTRFRDKAWADSKRSWRSDVTVSVYAVKENGSWRLANALPRHTATWLRDTVGPITYVYRRSYPYDRARAFRAVAFTDSLAAQFAVPSLPPITYYLATSVDEVYFIIGLESPMKFGPVGGLAQPVNRQLFSGIPSVGEEYRHELAHLVLAPLVSTRTTYFASEGVATWLGGTAGKSFPAAVQELALFLQEHPSVTLDSLISGIQAPAQMYPSAAALVALVHRAGGAAAVKEFLRAGPDPASVRSFLQRQLGKDWPSIAADWRRLVDTLNGRN